MSGYHYKLQIVPKFLKQISDENYWENEQPHTDMLVSYRQLLPEDNTWGETEEFRSPLNYSVLYIWWEKEKVCNIQFEYAPVESGDDLLLTQVLTLCEKYGYMLFSEETESIVAPSKIDLWEDFKKCSRFKIYENRISRFH